MGDWTFFSNHGHVLICLARDSDARLRDVAVQVGITERAVQKIVRDLQDEGYLDVSKHGRRNRYRINNRKALRHQLQSGCTVGQLLTLLGKAEASKPAVVAPKSGKEVAGPKPQAVEPERPREKPAAETSDPPARPNLEQGQLF